MLDFGARYQLSPRVGLRREPFGALAYHFETRRLLFLKSTELVALVEALGNYESLGAALDALVASGEHARYLQALAGLYEADVIADA